MNLNFNKTIKSCCTWLFFGLFLLGMSPDAIASTLTIKNEGNCAVNIYHWLTSGDVYQTTLQSGQNFQVDGSNGDKYRAVDTDNVWNSLIFDEHYMFNSNAHQTWTINTNYCNGGANSCNGQITDFQLNKQDGSALINLTEGATFCESDFSKDVKIRALVGGSHESLKFTIITPNGTHTKTENHLTYDSGQFWLSPGDYIVKAELFSHENLTGDICDTKMLSFTVRDCNAITIPSLNCDNSDFKFEGNDKFIYSSNTIEVKDLPTIFHNAPFVKITEIITADSYAGRVDRTQTHEQLKLVFKKNGVVTGISDYTPDLEDRVKTAFYQGTLADVQLNGGADKVYIVHPGNSDLGEDVKSSANSLYLKGLCLMAGAIVDPCANGGAPVATVVKNDPTCGNTDGKFTFSFDDRAGRTNIEFSIDGGNTYPYNVSDNVGSTMISNLGNGSYDLYVRWGNDDCPVSLGTFALTDGSQAPGTDCNDNNANTTNDVILADGCTCAGTIPTPVYDCPALEANIGDSCDDGNANTNNDVVTADCGCEGTQINIILPNISIDDVVVNEADGTASLTIAIDQISNVDVTVDFATTDGTANVGVDYVALTGTVTIPAGQQFATVTFDILEDTTDETDEVFNVVLSNPQSAVISGNIGTVTILDNDEPVVPGGCSAAYTVDGNVITITGVTGAIKTVKVLDEAWNSVFTCDEWSSVCNETESVTIPSCGTYYVQVQTYADWSTPICNLFETVVISDGCGAGVDCPGLGLNFGDACNDGNANTINDVVMQDCGCYGTPVGPQFDCPQLNANIGDACDDFNPNTNNDVVQANCSCAGSAGPSTCGVTYSVDGKEIFVENITGAIRSVKVLDENWGTIFSCDDWSTACGSSEAITVPSCGKYFIQVHTYADWSTTICNLFETVEITEGCGVIYDCPALEANIGDACNDGFLNTENDVITEDCVCAGTEIVPTGSLSINDVTVNEDAGIATLQICLDVASTNVVGVTFSPGNGTAVLNEDYVGLIGTANIPAGDLCVDVILPIQDDLTPEQTETFIVTLSNPQGALIADGEGIVTILDNDSTGPVYDCPALGANIGDACDDGNATTNNDLVQADCSCAGMPTNNTQCNATYTVDGRTITVENVTGAITAVKIIDNSWNVLYECNDWATPCQETEAFTVPTCGTYFVQVQTYADWSTVICNLFETVVIDADCDGGSPTCDNVTDGGAIAGDETLEAGTAASPITSATLPSGGTGAIEYIWLSATDRCPRFLSDTIPGAYGSTYDPGVLTETTYFVRCSRRAGCAENTDWQFGESNCVVKEVVATSPNTICAEREALNTRTCHADVLYGVWLQGEAYTIRDGKFIEYTDGTAKFTGHANGIGDIDVTFEGRVYHQDSVKFSGCLGETPTDDWYYYTTFSGTLGSHSVTPRGPIFQVGTGANVQQADEFGGAAWFDTHDGLKGDFNLHLTGAPALCQTVAARVSTNSFNAQIENGIVALDWTNNTGSQNDYFEVERSVDGVSFESIGVFETQGLDDTPTFYTSEDGSPLEGFNFYRLKLTFLDGTFEYSDIRRVKISDIESFGIFPNPARDYVNVSLKGYSGKDINIQLLNQMGQPLKSVQLENVADHNYTIELNGLNNGIYSIWIFAEGAKPVGKKMIVNKQY